MCVYIYICMYVCIYIYYIQFVYYIKSAGRITKLSMGKVAHLTLELISYIRHYIVYCYTLLPGHITIVCSSIKIMLYV